MVLVNKIKISEIIKDWIPEQLSLYLPPVEDLVDSIVNEIEDIMHKKYAYIYKVTFSKENEELYYIGIRKTDKDPHTDNYKGSPNTNKHIWHDKTYNINKEILEICDGKEYKKLLKKEYKVINEYFEKYGAFSKGGKCLNNNLYELQSAGIISAKERGTYIGRKETIDKSKIRSLLNDGYKPTEIAQQMDISRMSVYRTIGRPNKLSMEQEMEIIVKKENGQTVYSIAKHYKVDRSMIYRTLEKYGLK